MRGKGLSELAHTKKARITPAHAGKTDAVMTRVFGEKDHPRACGENSCESCITLSYRGSPPRMRGKHGKATVESVHKRITPAHAGKTPALPQCPSVSQDHPRACGENKYVGRAWSAFSGSPPRMRGKLQSISSARRGRRITPAHAGKTDAVMTRVFGEKDHPRACGENSCESCITLSYRGSPPRMRGKRHPMFEFLRELRITPAHAGKTLFCRRHITSLPDHPRACGENFIHHVL